MEDPELRSSYRRKVRQRVDFFRTNHAGWTRNLSSSGCHLERKELFPIGHMVHAIYWNWKAIVLYLLSSKADDSSSSFRICSCISCLNPLLYMRAHLIKTDAETL